MSIPVEVADLAKFFAEFDAGYLLTVTPTGTVKVVTVEPVVTDGVLLVAGPGKGTLANLARSGAVTLVFPPRQPKGFTLLVDGTGDLAGDDVQVTPTGAVLHRPANHAEGPPPPGGCGNDCAPVASSQA
jgi:hypothetical protein